MRGMKPLPSPGSWVRKAVGVVVFIAFLPVLLVAAAQVLGQVLGPVTPYIIVLIILLALYRLVLRVRR